MPHRGPYSSGLRLRLPDTPQHIAAQATLKVAEAKLLSVLSLIRPTFNGDGCDGRAVGEPLTEAERTCNRSQALDAQGRPIYTTRVTRGLIERINLARLTFENATRAERLAFEASRKPTPPRLSPRR